jgi:hypothetical protein
MKTDQQPEPAVFLQTVNGAVSHLKTRLLYDYGQAYPDLGEIIHIVLDEEEAKAWELSSFPHLLLPDLVEAHIAKLNLQPADTRHDDAFTPHSFIEIETDQPAFALCGCSN